jgi:hypothetical protein
MITVASSRTVSAVCKLRPKPPARVDKMKIKYGESGALNCASKSARSDDFVEPSRRKNRKPRKARYLVINKMYNNQLNV